MLFHQSAMKMLREDNGRMIKQFKDIQKQEEIVNLTIENHVKSNRKGVEFRGTQKKKK